ncbi:MAG: hypothetical protein ACTSYZ_02385 [Candidatus Helarchaeota archaeon]
MGLSKIQFTNYKRKLELNTDSIIKQINENIENELKQKKKNYRLICDYFWILGDAYKKKEEYLNSIESYHSALKYINKIKDNILDKNCRLAKSYYKIANVYIELQEIEEIIRFKNNTLNCIEKNKQILIQTSNFPLVKDNFEKYLNFIDYYYKILEESIKYYRKSDQLDKFEKRINKIWNEIFKEKNSYRIFEMGYILHILTIIAIIYKDYNSLWEYITLGFEVSSICECLTSSKSKFNKIWKRSLHEFLSLGINFIKSIYEIDESHVPENKNKLIDIILELNLEKQDIYYLEKLFRYKEKNNLTHKGKFNIHSLNAEIQKEGKIHSIVKILYVNELILHLLEKKEFLKAIELAENNLKIIHKEIKDKRIRNYFIARMNQILFRIEVKKQNYKESEKFGKKVINMFENEGIRRKYDLLLFIIEFANFNIQIKQYDKAKSYLNYALEIAKSKRNKKYELFMQIFESYAEISWGNSEYVESMINIFKSLCFYLIFNRNDLKIMNKLTWMFFQFLESKKFDVKLMKWTNNWV